MNPFFAFNSTYLVPAGLILAAAAVVLLILRRKRDGVRPPHAKLFLVLALVFFGFAFVTVILIPLIHLVLQLLEFGAAFFYSALKSL